MSERSLGILQVNTWDQAGGAEKVAQTLQKAYSRRGHSSWLAVGHKRGEDRETLLLPLAQGRDRMNGWAYAWLMLADLVSPLIGHVRGAKKLRNAMRAIAVPRLLVDVQKGYEDFNFPGTATLLNLPIAPPDVLHCHNLHGGYFDLRALSWLSQQLPTVLTLHDMWLLSGHCSHSYDCERWKSGCGSCPDLSIYPAIRRDATSYNLRRKQEIYSRSRFYVAAPSQWLMSKVEHSIVEPALAGTKIIPNGVDLEVFHPGDQLQARAELGIPQNTKVLLHVGYRTRNNIRKGYPALETAVRRAAEKLENEPVILICLGEVRESMSYGRVDVKFIDYETDPAMVARYYQAADIYVHTSKADTFPTVVLEALACGRPVVATAVGGVPEQVDDNVTGNLSQPGEIDSMASAICKLLLDDELRQKMGRNAADVAGKRFDLNRQVDEYLNWYEEILAEWKNFQSIKPGTTTLAGSDLGSL